MKIGQFSIAQFFYTKAVKTMLLNLKVKEKYLAIVVCIFVLELIISIFIHDQFIRPFFGDFLATILLFYCFKMLYDGQNWLLAWLCLGISFALEWAQYWQVLRLLGLEKVKILAIVLGNSFAYEDLVAYTLGILVALTYEINFIKYYFPNHDKA